jgi:competence protein ComEC
MKLPTVILACAFSAGIALGSAFLSESQLAHPRTLWFSWIVCAVAIVVGLILCRLQFIRTAGVVALCAWFLLGVTAVRIAKAPSPSDHVLQLLADGRMDPHAPVRWRGVLNDEPTHLPWGTGYELKLDSIAAPEGIIPVQGGVRFTLYADEPNEPLPDVHAGERVEILGLAHLPRQFKNPGSFDHRAYLARQDIDLTGTLRNAHLLTKLDSPPPSLWHRLARVRHKLRERLDALLASRPTESAVLRAMLLGDRTFLERADTVAFQKNGTYHVLVVAGLHVTALVVFVYWACRRLRLLLSATVLSALVLLIAYVAIVEDRPPIFRAALMATIVLLGRLLYRRLDLLNTAAMAALIILIASPQALSDPSFQLSFLAMAAIGGIGVPWLDGTVEPYVRALGHLDDATRDISHAPRVTQFRIELRWAARLLAARLPARLRRFSHGLVTLPIRFSLRVWELFAISLVLQLGMLPVMALYFHRVTLAGPIANVPAVALTTLLVPLGFVTLLLSFVWSGFAKMVAALLGFAAHLLVRATDWFAALPHLSYRVPGPPAWLLVAFLVLLLGFMAALRLRRRWLLPATLAPLLIAGYAVACHPFPPLYNAGKLELTILDVGQGDSLFVVSPHGRTLLVDGGGSFVGFGSRTSGAETDPGEEAVSPYLWSRGFQRLDLVALTHAHRDHIGGLLAILENFPVGALWIGREVDSGAQRALERLARVQGVPVIHQARGATFDWDGVHQSVLWPEASSDHLTSPAQNNDSLVFRLQLRNQAFLLSGDIEKQAERAILSATPADSLRSDLLKVAHHGGRTSTLPEFLEEVRPQVAVISVGAENIYGHPSQEVLDRLIGAGARILRTDRDGTVRVLTDGEKLSVECFVACPDKSGQ